MFTRSSGVLLHITSLPSPHGIGTMGKAAYEFIDFLQAAQQQYWQVLPLGHTGFGESPYQCYSAAAGNPYLIDLDMLQGLVTQQELAAMDAALAAASPEQVDFDTVKAEKDKVLRAAFSRAKPCAQLDAFVQAQAQWLPDYALFCALKQHFDDAPLSAWPDSAIKARSKDAMEKYTALLAQDIAYYTFVQYLFFTQWTQLHDYAHAHGVKIIGDIPIYVSPDSADVWAQPALFKLQKDLSPRRIAGVPPDYFSETGQLWGNPVYDWRKHEKQHYAWWIWRIQSNLALYDVLRIDHFRGFESYWEVPADEETAVNGIWRKGPDMKLVRAIQAAYGKQVPLIAEDLGVQTDKVRRLLKNSGFPGMRVLIFGFDLENDSEHLPHNYPQNCIAYTSTHDSQTVREQVEHICTTAERVFALQYLRANGCETLGMSAIKSVFASPACIAMAAMQDVLSLGPAARMNIPATVGGNNWRWRMRADALKPALSDALRQITQTYKRAPMPEQDEI